LLGTLEDITERKKTEEALKNAYKNLEEKVKERTLELQKAYEAVKKSEQGLCEAQKMAHLGNWEWDFETDNGSWSEEVYRIYGLDPKEFKPNYREFLNLVNPEDRIFVENYLKAALTGKTLSIDFRINSADGIERIVHEQGEVIFNEENRPVRMKGTIQDITERRQAEKALEKINKIRIKEIHHRIKNNLQVVSSLLSLEAERYNDENMLNAFKQSQSRVTSMALIHEELYRGNRSDTLDFAIYLDRLTQDLFKSYNVGHDNIRLNLELENIFLDMDTAIPLGIIANELVSNSLKHAFPDGTTDGEICITLQKAESLATEDLLSKALSESSLEQIRENNFDCILKVADNGKGVPDEIEFENTESLGFQLVNVLVDQIDGQIELERGEGVKFTLLFSDINK
jgi:PAS domain S-box-containing protein